MILATFHHKTQAGADIMRQRLELLIRETPIFRSWTSHERVSDRAFTIKQTAESKKGVWSFETELHANESGLADTDTTSIEQAIGILILAALDTMIPAPVPVPAQATKL